MDGLARFFQVPISLRLQQRPKQKLFGENGFGSTRGRESIQACLTKACTLPLPDSNGKASPCPPEHFSHIQQFLEMLDAQDGRLYPHVWSLRPRIYALLHAIGALKYMDDFAKNNIYDISIPFDHQTLPSFLSDTLLRRQFLDNQARVLTDARHLENSAEDHMYFNGSADDHIVPYHPIGHGGFGYVDIVLSRLSAKPYARKRVARGRDSEDNRRIQQYLVDEIRLMKTLRHRHLTKIIQSYSDYKYIGFLMEPIADHNLYQYLSRKPFPEDQLTELRQFYGCLAGGVDYLHQKNIRHRDLKLDNVLVKGSRVFIADFGTAWSWTASGRGTTQSRGVPVTQHYMAPEFDEKQSRNVASDMWSLGLVFLEMLTVIKGSTLSRWKEHMRKRADRAGFEPWPCRNLAAVHEWMTMLTSARRHNWVDDESLVWRDNEPLTWIKALLEHNPDARPTSKGLVTTIADSLYSRSFACPDCAEDFMDPHYRYNDGYGSVEDSRDRIESEVFTMFGSMAEPPEQMDDRKTQTVTKWLEQTQQYYPASEYEEPKPFPMPGSFTGWLDEEASKGQMASTLRPHEPVPGIDYALADDRTSAQSKSEDLHDSGFFIDHEDESSNADTVVGEPPTTAESALFPIVQDSSSDDSDGSESRDLSSRDLPMLDQIPEELEESPTPETFEWDRVAHLPSSELEDGNVRAVQFAGTQTFRYQYVEDDTSMQTLELLRGQRALPATGPILEPIQGHASHSVESGQCLEQQQHDYSEMSVAQSSIEDAPAEDMPLTGAMVERLLERPPPAAGNKKKPGRPHLQPKKAIALPWHGVSEQRFREAASHGPPLENDNDAPKVAGSGLIEDAQSSTKAKSKLKREQKASVDGSPSKSRRTKLSAANVGRLNSQVAEAVESDKKSIAEETFNPAAFIEAAWKSAEAADSLATSVISEASSKKLGGGMGLLWNDKAYSHLERYTRLGKSAAVKVLLAQGCNSGTISKPRPRPLVNAIEGRSTRHNKCARALIKAGTNVNAIYRGKTPINRVLEQSYFVGYQKLLAMLLAAGAEVNSPDTTGEYPLTKLFKGAVGDAPLEDYRKESLALIFHPGVQVHVDPNVRQPITLDTPLHQAVRRRTAQAIALLIHKGSDVNARNATGTTPLLMAANQWRRKLSDQQELMLRYLLHADGIDVDATGGILSRTALHHAAAAGCALALEMLLESGASTSVLDKEGKDAMAVLHASWNAESAADDWQLMCDMLKPVS